MHDALIAGRYRLLDRLGVGGMATVWRARDERTREIVAVKRLHPHVLADPTARARLEREAEALRAVDHPAIVRPRDLVDDPDSPALVMDFVAGRPIAERIADGPLPPGEAVAVATIVAGALATAHDQGIVHRDIKPGNILVDEHGTLHLVDFGIAALQDSPVDDLTAETEMVGTLRYAAPERLAGEAASPRTDVWALGAVLYELLTGRPAVTSTDPAGALAASRAAPADIRTLPAAIAPVVAGAMAADPADRFPDAAAFRDALAAAAAPVDPEAATRRITLDDAPAGVVGTSKQPASSITAPVGSGRDRPARRAAWVALALSVALAVGALAAGAGRDETAGNSPPPAAAEEPPSPDPTAVPAPTAVKAATGPGGGSDKGKGKAKGKGNGKGPHGGRDD